MRIKLLKYDSGPAWQEYLFIDLATRKRYFRRDNSGTLRLDVITKDSCRRIFDQWSC